MYELTNWLISIEDAAYGFYTKAAALFNDDKGLSALLRHLADDEKMHGEIVRKAFSLMKDSENEPKLVRLDDDSMRAIEKDLLHYGTKLNAGTLTKDELVEAIVNIEFSESNDAFLCVLNSLKGFPDLYYSSASNIQQHKKYVEWFVRSRPEYAGLLKKVLEIPGRMETNLLVVDDEESMIKIINVVLSQEGRIDSARNGYEALKKLDEKHFQAVIADVDMPVQNGIDFYKNAVIKYPYLAKRFVFLSGRYDEERADFFKRHHLINLIKPASIKEIKLAVKEVLRRV